MELGLISGVMEADTLGPGQITTQMGTGDTSGLMEEVMKEAGLTTSYTAKDSMFGLMAASMRAPMLTTRKKAMAITTGLTVNVMKDNGITGNSMVKEGS